MFAKPRGSFQFSTVALCTALVLILVQMVGYASPPDPGFKFAGGTLLTGNYVVGSVDLTEALNPPDQEGLSTGTIHMSGVPDDSEVVAAYLYFEAITLTADLGQASVKFRGQEIPLDDLVAVKKASQDLSSGTATCWSSGTPLTMTQYRVDVLRLLPVRLDKDNKPTAIRLVNDSDLTAHGQPLHTVTLPTRSGNQIPESGGGSLVVVYLNRSQPLRKVVIYDGIHIQDSTNEVTELKLRGFYKSSATKSAKVTYLLGSGQPNNNEQFYFNDGPAVPPPGAPPYNATLGSLISPSDPITIGTSSQRGWSSLTYDVTSLMNPLNDSAGGYGETATTTVKHAPGGGYDCLTLAAVIFSTAVADNDPANYAGAPAGDGIPDGLEGAPAVAGTPLKDPNDKSLPDLIGMGAQTTRRDLFIEVNTTKALAGTTYGSPSAPYDASHTSVTDSIGHTHMPTPADLRSIADVLVAHGITPHFDIGKHEVGDPTGYHGLGVISHSSWIDDYTSTEAEDYLVPSSLARGGETIVETACPPSSMLCQFPDYPGTVGWKLGMQLHRDAEVGDDGEELTLSQLTDPSDPNYFDWASGTQRVRFDRNRYGLFHYFLYAHMIGIGKSLLPCLVNGQPAPYHLNNGTACTTNNPEFHVPIGASGVGDVPGGNAMVTMGRWEEFVGKPFVRASTAFHELGHNLNLSHGGLPITWGNKAANTATYSEPHCKPDYLSSMNYSFQVHGLLDDLDHLHFDYSDRVHNDLDETLTLGDGGLSPLPLYRTAWFAPAGSALATTLGVSPAKRFCGGLKFAPNSPPPSTARVYNEFIADSIDWNGDGLTNVALPQQDVNFDATVNPTFHGFDDWTSLRLNQIEADRSLRVFGLLGVVVDSGFGVVVDTGSGVVVDNGFGVVVDNGFGVVVDNGFGVVVDNGFGVVVDNGFGVVVDNGFGVVVDNGLGVVVDNGFGVVVDNGLGQQEVDVDGARASGRPVPRALNACIVGTPGCAQANPPTLLNHARRITFEAPSFEDASVYQFSRKRGNAASSFPYVSPNPTSTTTTTTYDDGEGLPNNVVFTYRTKAEYDDTTPHEFSGFSRTVTITAVNDPPVAVADAYTTTKNKSLKIGTQALGVLGNDTDVDSPATLLRAVLVSNPSNGTLVLNANGTFTYTPKNGFFDATDSFTYKANNGFWSADSTVPMSADSNTVTVTITVNAK